MGGGSAPRAAGCATKARLAEALRVDQARGRRSDAKLTLASYKLVDAPELCELV